jgi:hypothetical protein
MHTKFVVGKPEGKRPLGRRGRGWEDNIRMDLGEMECGGVDWIHVVLDEYQWRAVMKAVEKLRVP